MIKYFLLELLDKNTNMKRKSLINHVNSMFMDINAMKYSNGITVPTYTPKNYEISSSYLKIRMSPQNNFSKPLNKIKKCLFS